MNGGHLSSATLPSKFLLLISHIYGFEYYDENFISLSSDDIMRRRSLSSANSFTTVLYCTVLYYAVLYCTVL